MIIVHTSTKLASATGGGIVSAASSELRLLVELLPFEPAGNYQDVGARLFIGGENIPIISFEETADEQTAGKTVTVELHDPNDKSKLTADAEFLIETYVLSVAGEPVWEPCLSGKINSKSVNIANADGKPNDSVSFTSISTDRLRKSPTRNLVVYDSARSEVDTSEFEPVYDTTGKAYTLEAINVPGLSLHKLFDLILKERCGFASVKSNLPDYPIRRADFSIFGTYYDGIKPFIGMFKALDFQTADNVLWLTDPTATLPAGFPAPRVLQAAKIQSISADSQVEKIKCFEMQFSQSEEGDFFTTKTVPTEQETRTRSGTLIAKTLTKTKIRQYRSNYARSIVLREVVASETVETYGANSIFPSEITTETFTFDYLGRQKQSVKTVQKRLPDMTAGGAVSLREVSEVELNHKYGVFPFSARKQFLKRTELIEHSIIAVDAENQYLGADFPQEITVAHRSGNLKDGMTESYGVTKSATEVFKPLPDGTVKVFRTEIDHTPEFVGREAIVTTSRGEPRAGDISVSGNSRPGKVYVFLDDNDTFDPDADNETFAVGELPLNLAIPLVKRLLENQGKDRLSIPIVGWNKTVAEGTILTAHGRDGETVNCVVTGYRKFLSGRNGYKEFGMTLSAREI